LTKRRKEKMKKELDSPGKRNRTEQRKKEERKKEEREKCKTKDKIIKNRNGK
jgi:hypothetical protein